VILGAGTVTILRGASRDNFGDITGSDTGTEVTGCSVQPGSSTEQTDRGELVVTTLTVYLPAGTDILATDRVSVGGTVYEVDGDPARWVDQAGTESHVQAILRLTKGGD
jgi:hypothetical protein